VKSLLISGTYFPPETGGISHYMGAVVSKLGPARACCLTGVPETNGAPAHFASRIYRRPAAFGGPKALQAVTWAATIAEIHLRDRPEVVQLATTSESYLGLWLRRWLHLPFVIYAHGNEVLAALRERWAKPRAALRTADRVLANSRFTAGLLRAAGVAEERIAVIYPGCDVDQFRPGPGDAGLRRRLLGDRWTDRIILTVGGLVARKGHDMVIRALPRLSRTIPALSYLIVGDGPYRARLEDLAEGLGVRARVVFAGAIPTEDLPGVYRLCDVFVMASRENLEACDVEGFGLVYLEANACAKPVVGGRSGGVPEAVVDGVTGLLADPADPEDVARALERLLTSRDLADRLGHQGRSRVASDLRDDLVADRIHQAMVSVLAERRRTARRERP
jgi:phosphatidylinositol alpha-1,6-mannosyltransferase